MTGHLFGSTGDVKYMPISVRYSYLMHMNDRFALRYSTELTPLAMLDWPTPQNPSRFDKRTRSYGSGLSPIGLQASLFPNRRVQPFLSTNLVLLRFGQPVLSAQGPQWVSDTSVGAGINIFRKLRQDVTIGYRYEHLASATFASQPSTDTNTFYVAVSRFHTNR